jgi:hypothetical protein
VIMPTPPAPSNSCSSGNSIAAVVPLGDRRKSLEAIRDRLAQETDDTLWMRHKAECACFCGMGDGRLLVTLAKELRETIRELESLPVVEKGESPVERARSAAAAKRDELAARRAHRGAGGAAS